MAKLMAWRNVNSEQFRWKKAATQAKSKKSLDLKKLLKAICEYTTEYKNIVAAEREIQYVSIGELEYRNKKRCIGLVG